MNEYIKIYKELKGDLRTLRFLFGVNGKYRKLYEEFSFLGEKYSEFFYRGYYNLKEAPLCKTCKKEKVKFKGFGKGYYSYCSYKCINNNPEVRAKIEATTFKRTGYKSNLADPKVRKQIKATNIEKTGYKTPFSNPETVKRVRAKNLKEKGWASPFESKEIREMIKRKCLKEHGVENHMQRKEIKEKTALTNSKKTDEEKKGIIDKIKKAYNKKSKIEKKKIKEKAKETNIERYGEVNPMKNKDVKKKLFLKKRKKNIEDYKKRFNEYIEFEADVLKEQVKDYVIGNKKIIDEWVLVCKKCKKEYKAPFIYNGFNKCPYCYPIKKSKKEEAIKNFIEKNTKEDVIMNTRKIIKPYELDLFIENKKIAIEYNGILWHSFGKTSGKGEKSQKLNNHMFESDEKYNHLNKTNLCEEKEIQLLHIFENEWLDNKKRKIWESIISSSLGSIKERYYARKLIINLKVDKKIKNKFLEENHLQGKTNSPINIGLETEEGELLSLMTFGKVRYEKEKENGYELLRFVSKKNTSIIGGASRILKSFIKDYGKKGKYLITYADRRYSKGNVYKKIGFTFIKNTEPNYFYWSGNTNNLRLESRLKYQRHKLEKNLSGYDKEISAKDNLYNKGYRRIYDCGNKKYRIDF